MQKCISSTELRFVSANPTSMPANSNLFVIEPKQNPISFPEPANFLQLMLDESEGSGKDQFLGDLIGYLKCNTISPLFADY